MVEVAGLIFASQVHFLIGILAFLLVVQCFLLIKSRSGFWFKFSGIPILLSLMIAGWYTLEGMVGFPKSGLPPDSTKENPIVYIDHQVLGTIGITGNKVLIHLWTYERRPLPLRKKKIPSTRLYEFVHTMEREKKLRKAKESTKRGVAIRLGRSNIGELEIHQFLPQIRPDLKEGTHKGEAAPATRINPEPERPNPRTEEDPNDEVASFPGI